MKSKIFMILMMFVSVSAMAQDIDQKIEDRLQSHYQTEWGPLIEDVVVTESERFGEGKVFPIVAIGRGILKMASVDVRTVKFKYHRWENKPPEDVVCEMSVFYNKNEILLRSCSHSRFNQETIVLYADESTEAYFCEDCNEL